MGNTLSRHSHGRALCEAECYPVPLTTYTDQFGSSWPDLLLVVQPVDSSHVESSY